MINYQNLADSVEFYKGRGYVPIEVPWTVTEYVDNITKPKDRIHYQLKHNNKCLVASGEQGFLYLYLKDYLPLGKFQTITPCFRDEPYDLFHEKCFMKNELIITGEFSKIEEEFTELLDAHKQDAKVLEICELTDLIGAIKYYALNKFNLSLGDLLQFSQQTENAFKNGKR